MTELLELITKTYGLVGLLIVAPVASTVYLWRHIVKVQADLVSRDAAFLSQLVTAHEKSVSELKLLHQSRIDDVARVSGLVMEVQEKRVSDAQIVVAKLITTISDQTAMNSETNLALERMGDFIALSQTKSIPQHSVGDKDKP